MTKRYRGFNKVHYKIYGTKDQLERIKTMYDEYVFDNCNRICEDENGCYIWMYTSIKDRDLLVRDLGLVNTKNSYRNREWEIAQ